MFLVLFLLLFVNSFPENEDNIFDYVSLNPDCDPHPKNRPITERNTAACSDDSTNQYPDLGLRMNPQFLSVLPILGFAKR